MRKDRLNNIVWGIITTFLVLNVTAAAQSVLPVNGVTPALTPVTINAGPGDQNDPHVSGEWAAYTSDLWIRYYNFATNVDAEIPLGPLSSDLLSDISGSKIVFSRVISGDRTAVMVFDAATAAAPLEIDAAPGTIRLGSAIGGNTIAYIDFGLDPNGELVIHDLTTSTSVRITNDILPDQSPSVSPDGNVVIWEHCNATMSNCDIWQAVKSGPGWTVSPTANSSDAEHNPDSSGALVAYDSFRGGNSDIFWRPVGGGTEVKLQTSSFENNPSIVGNFISFESRTTLGASADIFVYDIVNNRLYQITNTPLVTEQLNDITVLPNGDLRVVWASDEDGSSSRNVKATTFSLPDPMPCQGTLVPGSLGSLLPLASEATITQGGAPNFADTYVTPYVATQPGMITSWKAEFVGGVLIGGGSGVPSGVQLKILRYNSANILEVVAASAVYDPRPILQSRFGVYPFFSDLDSVIEFSGDGLSVLPGDLIGLTITSDPTVGGYYYPLVAPSGSRLVLRDVAIGGTIDLADNFTASLAWTPAIQVNLSNCSSFNFLGFFQPVDNLPTLNVVTGGQAIPVKFSLDGNQGLGIFAAGYPASSQIACAANEPGAIIEETVAAGGSSLSYDASVDQYTYVWKTQKAWKGSCRMLNVRLSDGTDHFAKFRFK